MPSKISPKLREQAAIYCSARASFWAARGTPHFDFTLAASQRVRDLALEAARPGFNRANEVPTERNSETYCLLWAEAHALLMTGWEP